MKSNPALRGGLFCLAAFSLSSLPVAIVQANVVSPESWVTLPQTHDPLLTNLAIPADAAVKGMWSGVHAWPMNGLHAALLPDGRVLTFGTPADGESQNGRYYDVWDPALGVGQGAHNTVYDPSRQDSFCAAATYLNDGSLLISGGNGVSTSTIYDPSSHSSYTAASTMAAARWYATMISLPDGRPVMMGGMVPYTEDMRNNPSQAIANGWPSMTPEIYENGQWRSLFGAYSRLAFGPDYLRTSYPRAWVAPDGRVFGISAEQMWYLDADANGGNGEVISAGTFKGPYSSSAPVNVGATNTAVMFAPGKILQVGGNGGFNGDALPASNMATVIDINAGAPVLTEQPRMGFARRYPNAIVLADGNVVISGGTTYGNNSGSASVNTVEIWNPVSGTWTTGASAVRYRGYHSVTTLLANGTVLSTGGGTPGPVLNLNAEIYYPPYLFESVNGVSRLAQRPVMSAISGLSHANGAEMQIDMLDDSPVSQLVLIGLSSGTHSFNTGQRRIPLTFTQQQFRLSTALPDSATVPPGYYQVVALGANGAPSVGAIIAVGQNQAAPPVVVSPYTPPNLEEPIVTPVIGSGQSASYTVTPEPGATYRWHFSDTDIATAYSADPSVTHLFATPGVHVVTLSARSAGGAVATRTFVQAVSTARTAESPRSSSALALETRSGAPTRLWAVNPDNDSVAVIDTATNTRIAEIKVGASPRSVAVAPDGRIWVTNKNAASISILNPVTLTAAATVALPAGSQPHGLIFAPAGNVAYVVLEAGGRLLKLDASTGAQLGSLNIGANARHLAVSSDAATVLVTRFITPPLPGESTAVVNTATAGAEVLVVNAQNLTLTSTRLLRHSDKIDTEIQGSGIPNYLGAPAISPDGFSAWIPSKQDNIKRGVLRNGQPLDFQNTVRAISSKLDLVTLTEDLASRVDHDNSGLGSAAAFHPNGVYLFVALETSREVAVVNAINGSELFRIAVGLAPQGVAVSADGTRLYVSEFIGRSVSVVDLSSLIGNGQLTAQVRASVKTIVTEKLAFNVLKGKEFFYDARNPKLARDAYMSCASCHNDGGQDGRVWDMTGFGEGLRNTVALNGRAGLGHGLLHWSANFDEVQDFERQIREFAGGAGLMTDAAYNTGSRNQPLGDRKAGVSVELDQLAAYVNSLTTFAPSPNRNANGTLTTAATAGRQVFAAQCAACHGSGTFTISNSAGTLVNVGTLNGDSGQRLNAPLTGLDVPTLRDAWATAPYLHNGSAPTLQAAIQAHTQFTLTATDLANVIAFVQQIGNGPETFNASPIVAMTTPANGEMVTKGLAVTLAASALDVDGSIGKVQFMRGTTLLYTDRIAPYSYNWIADGNGAVDISAKAFDNSGAISSSAPVRLQVNNPPAVKLTSPSSSKILLLGSPVNLAATASDTDGTVARVEFYAGSTLVATFTGAPYTFTLQTTSRGRFNVTARAYDNNGAVTVSNAVSITVL